MQKNHLSKFTLLILLLSFLAMRAYSQKAPYVLHGNEASNYLLGAKMIRFNDNGLLPSSIIFNKKAYHSNDVLNFNKHLGLREGSLLENKKISTDKIGFSHQKVVQKFNGYKVIGAEYVFHSKDGLINSANGYLVKNIKADLNVALSEMNAYTKALKHLKIEDKESNTQNSGILYISSKDYDYAKNAHRLVYQFEIYVVSLRKGVRQNAY